MSNAKHLTKRQRAVLEDLFTGQIDEQEVLAKHKEKKSVPSIDDIMGAETWAREETFRLCYH